MMYHLQKNKIAILASAFLASLLLSQATMAEDFNTNTARTEQNSPQDGINLISNGDFTQTETTDGLWNDAKASNWSIWLDNRYKDSSPNKRIQISDETLTITSPETLRAVVHQTVTIDPTKKYIVRFRLKTDDRTGQTFVRIIEGEGNDKHLWYSSRITGTTDWQTVEQEYTPIPSASNIKLELFYETGTGTANFKQIELIEKVEQASNTLDEGMESTISLPLGKKYLLKEGYTYEVENQELATSKGGILEPLHEGQTVLKVYKDGEFTHSISLTIAPSSQDQYTPLLEQWNEMIAGNALFNPNDEYMANFNTELEEKVSKSLETLSLSDNRTFLWQEFSDYHKSSNITATYRKLEEMAKQVTNPHSQYYQDEQTIRHIREAIEWLHQNVYNASKEIDGNWWDYEIGTPRALNNTLSLMHTYFSDDELKTYTDVIEKFVPDPYYFRKTTNPFKALGGNLVDMGRVKIIAGLLRKDEQEIATTISSIEQVFTLVDQGEGFYQDGSYIDHTNVAYTGAYGNVLIDGLSQLLPIIQQTSHPLSDEKMQVMYHWIDKSFLPLIIHGELLDLSRGRSISRSNSEDHVAAIEVLRGIHRIAEMSDEATKQRLKATIKTIVQSDTFYDSFHNLKTYRDIHLMEELLNDNTIQPLPRESYLATFNDMDKLTYYNTEKDFGFGLSLFSSRTKNYEAMNKENKKGWYTSDGMFYLYNGDLGHYSNHYWPTVNPYAMAGTTELTGQREDESGQGVLPSPFVGIAKLDERYATAAMDFTNWNKELAAHKSWTILNDKIAFLGSAIKTDSATETAFTTIEQRKIDPASPYTVYINNTKESISNQEKDYLDTSSIFLESTDTKKNIGYFFLTKSAVSLVQKTQEGSWKDINSSQSDATVQNEFLTILQHHPENNAHYAYILIPNVSRETFQQMTEKLSEALIENNSDLQVVYDAEQAIWSIVKYDDQPSTISGQFQVLKRGIYMIRKENNEYKIVYYNPETKGTATESEVFQKLISTSLPLSTNSSNSSIDSPYLPTLPSRITTSTSTTSSEFTPADSASSTPVLPINKQKKILPKTGTNPNSLLSLFGFYISYLFLNIFLKDHKK